MALITLKAEQANAANRFVAASSQLNEASAALRQAQVEWDRASAARKECEKALLAQMKGDGIDNIVVQGVLLRLNQSMNLVHVELVAST